MTRGILGLLILLMIILYSKHESRHKRHPESCIAALFRWLIPRQEARVQASCVDTQRDLPNSQSLRMFVAIPSTPNDRTLAQPIDRPHSLSYLIAVPACLLSTRTRLAS